MHGVYGEAFNFAVQTRCIERFEQQAIETGVLEALQIEGADIGREAQYGSVSGRRMVASTHGACGLDTVHDGHHHVQ